MDIKQNLLHKTWTAVLTGWRRRRRRLSKEKHNAKKTCKIKMYMHITNTKKDCGFSQERPVLPSGKTRHDKQHRNCLDYSQNLFVSPRGVNAKTDRLTECLAFWRTEWLTDRQTDSQSQSNSDLCELKKGTSVEVIRAVSSPWVFLLHCELYSENPDVSRVSELR
jgi:hypothetical protein